MKTYKKSEFGTAQIAEILPGQSVVVECKNAREVHNVRMLACQYRRLSTPANILRYATECELGDDGTHFLTMTAVKV